MRIPNRHLKNPEAGGVTILVVLMLLVLLTIAAVGMSRNSFREIVMSGTARQGGMARNVADSGVEWGIYWLDLNNSQASDAPLEAQALNALKVALLKDQTLSGRAWDITSTATLYTPGANSVVALPTSSTLTDTTQTFTAGLTRMGKLPITDMSQGNGTGAFAPASGAEVKQAPDLWALRSDGQVTVGGVTFTHAKEAWISTAVQSVP